VNNNLFSLGMVTYFYENQDIIQIPLKRLPGGWKCRKKKLVRQPSLYMLVSLPLSILSNKCRSTTNPSRSPTIRRFYRIEYNFNPLSTYIKVDMTRLSCDVILILSVSLWRHQAVMNWLNCHEMLAFHV
jgi:hypothetical protein